MNEKETTHKIEKSQETIGENTEEVTGLLSSQSEGGIDLQEVEIALVVKELKKMICSYLQRFIFPCCLVTFWGILIGISQIVWEKSLLACDYDIIVCIKWLKEKFLSVIWEIVFYSLVHYYIFLHGFFHPIPYIRATGISLATLSFCYRYLTSHGLSQIDHSKANVQLAGIIMVIFAMITFSFWVTAKIFKKKGVKIGSAWLSFWAILLLIVYYERVIRSCDHLEDSLVESVKYTDSEGDCKWEKGKVCWHYTIDGIFRPFFWGRDDCTKMNTNMDLHRELSKDTRILSYPMMTKYNFREKSQQYELQSLIMDSMKSVTEEEMENGDKEVFIDFRKNYNGEILIKVKNLLDRNETVRNRVKKSDKQHLNILNIFIDTLSRNNFHRKYKNTREFLKKYHYSQKKSKRVYEYFRLHSIRGYTFPNLFASTYGIRNDKWDELHLKRIDSYAKEAGYITGISSDCCVYPESESKKGGDPYEYSDLNDPDHMFYQISCDYNNMPKVYPFTFGFGKGPYSVSRNCFLKRDLSGIVLEYAHKFFETYKEERKFFTARIISAHEFTGENNWYIDVELAKFLEKMDEKHLLDDTIVNIFSDHGDHIDFLMWSTDSGYAELMNPVLFVMVPKEFDQKYGDNLKANQQRLMTHFQLFRNYVEYWDSDLSKIEYIQETQSFFFDKLSTQVGCSQMLVKEDCKCFVRGD